jgi:hypothetical protein
MKASISVVLAATAALLASGCGQQTTVSPPVNNPAPHAVGSSGHKQSPYTREYYQKMAKLSAAELQKKVKPGMHRSEVTDVLGKPLTVTATLVEYARNDANLVITLQDAKVVSTQLKPHK